MPPLSNGFIKLDEMEDFDVVGRTGVPVISP